MQQTIKRIHFVGIKGVGMTPLAIIAKEAGLTVTGCDVGDSFITDASLEKAKIAPLTGFSPSHLEEVDLVITTGAHGGFDNPEVKAAKERGIEVLTQGEAVGKFMDGSLFGRKQVGISIAGTHGKTTTTAMVATILKACGLDSSYIIGTSEIPSLGLPGHFGKGKYFVAEADEYATEPTHNKTPKFLNQHPKTAVFTSIELDHTDVFETIDAMRDAFLAFARQLPEDGVLIACGDDPEILHLLKDYTGRAITYGLSPANQYVIKRVSVSGDRTFFWLDAERMPLGEFSVRAIGEHNALNATAAMIASLEAGLPIEKVKQALLEFSGTKRRFEYIGKLQSGAALYDDYAHHPTAIKKTLQAFRQLYPKKKLVCIFQPHTYSRTKRFFQDFLQAFDNADSVVLMDIYASAREQTDPSVSSALLAQHLATRHRDVIYAPQAEDVIQYIGQNSFGNQVVVITMGAGDVYKIREALPLRQDE